MKDPEEDAEDENKDRRIHLMPFPINITQEGLVGPEVGWEYIPDSMNHDTFENVSMEGETDWTLKLANRVVHVSQRGKQQSTQYSRKSSLRELVSTCTRVVAGKVF